MSFSPRFVKLSEVTTLRNGAGIKQENFTDESNGIPLVKVSNFTQNSINMSDLTMVNFDHAQKWKSHLIQRGNVLIATVGSWPPNWSSVVGKVVRAPQNAEGSIQNQNTCCLIPTEELHEGYLYYKLKDPKFLEWVVNIAQGSANQARVPVKKLGEYQFELPPMEVQKSIADALESLDFKISANSQTNQTLEEMAQAIFKSWFVDFDPVKAKMNGEQPEGMDAATASLFPEKLVSDTGLPEGWIQGSIADIAKLNGQSWTKKKHPEQVHYVDLANTKNGVIESITTYDFEDSPSRARRVLKDGDTIVGTVRPGNRSFAYIGETEKPLTGSTGFAVLSPKEELWSSFIYLATTNDDSIDEYARLADGGAYPAIKPAIVAETACAIPSEDIAKKFWEITEPMLKKAHQNRQENEELAALRDTLLPKLLSGELSLSD
ncbi:restriction endonuclease subunit S [Vibrio splendidus]